MRVLLGSLVATLTLSGLAGAQPVTITSFDPTEAAPFSTLTITGSGFEPSTNAISVLILPNAGASNACSCRGSDPFGPLRPGK